MTFTDIVFSKMLAFPYKKRDMQRLQAPSFGLLVHVSCRSLTVCACASFIFGLEGWLVGCFGFDDPLREYISLYLPERGRKKRKLTDEKKSVQTTPPAPIASNNSN